MPEIPEGAFIGLGPNNEENYIWIYPVDLYDTYEECQDLSLAQKFEKAINEGWQWHISSALFYRPSIPSAVVEPILSINGLTAAELKIANSLRSAYEEYLKLPIQHPEERKEFARAINHCQLLLAVRVHLCKYHK